MWGCLENKLALSPRGDSESEQRAGTVASMSRAPEGSGGQWDHHPLPSLPMWKGWVPTSSPRPLQP